jgi:predicted nucleic acid-binding protein
VAGRVAFDTTFLIDLQRERSRGEPDGPAHRLLRADPDLELHLSATALGEFAESFDDSDDPVLRTVRELHVLLPIDEQSALAYGRVTRSLRQRGTLIGTNDLWIAAASRNTTSRLLRRTPRSSVGCLVWRWSPTGDGARLVFEGRGSRWSRRSGYAVGCPMAICNLPVHSPSRGSSIRRPPSIRPSPTPSRTSSSVSAGLTTSNPELSAGRRIPPRPRLHRPSTHLGGPFRIPGALQPTSPLAAHTRRSPLTPVPADPRRPTSAPASAAPSMPYPLPARSNPLSARVTDV